MNFNKIIKKDFFIFLLFLLIFYAIFRYSGTFTRGYDIYDDQDIISANISLESNSFSSVLSEWIKHDAEWKVRFRPVAIFYFLTTVKLFGFNLKSINIYLAFLCVCTSFLFYRFCINIGFSVLQSILFALLSLIGPATVMWVQPPSVAESIGMFFLSLSFYFLSKSIQLQKNKFLYNSLFVLSLFLTMLCKESFLIITPAILFLYVWFYSVKNNTGIIQSLKKNYIILISTSVFFLICVIYVVKLVGVQSQGYAGVNINYFSSKIIIDFIDSSFRTGIVFVVLFGIIILLDNKFHNNNFKSSYFIKQMRSFLLPLGFMLLVIVPQFILYYKSGFNQGRYYLPYLIGFSFFSVYLLKIITDSKSMPSFLKYFYLCVIILFLSLESITNVIPTLTKYSDGCKATSEMLKSITSSSNDKLLIVMDPVGNYQEVISIKTYLDYLKKDYEFQYDFIERGILNNMYSNAALKKSINELSNREFGKNQLDSTMDNSDIGNVLIFIGLNDKFLIKNQNWFRGDYFQKKKIGGYTIYSK